VTIARYSHISAATLLYDADCGLCRATAAWLGYRVAPSALRLMALTDVVSDPSLADRVAGRDLKSMLHLVAPDGRVSTGARAVLAAGRLVPRWRVLARLFDHRIGHLVLEPLYRLIAGHRRQVSRLLRLPATCPVPTPAERPGATERGTSAIAS
jgi:predicted DCC family thiol-disulfide oxidoreductase YuxK